MRASVFAISIFILMGVASFYTVSVPTQFSSEDVLERIRGTNPSLVAAIHKNAPEIIDEGGIKGMMEVVALAFEKRELSLNDCHSLSHRVGHDAVTVYREDFEGILEHASDFCARGYLHGAEAQIVLEGSDFSSRLGRFCIALKTKIHGATCFHGAGHALMNQSLYVKETLGWCDALREEHSNFAYTADAVDCYEGTFAELTNILGGYDGETGIAYEGDSPISISEAPVAYCSQLDAKYQERCAFELSALNIGLRSKPEDVLLRLKTCTSKEATEIVSKACLYNISANYTRHQIALSGKVVAEPWILSLSDELQHYYFTGAAQEISQHKFSGQNIDGTSFCESSQYETVILACKEYLQKFQ